LNDEVVDDRAIGIVDGTLVTVDVIAWEALPRAYDGLAGRILGSFEPAAASTALLGEPSRMFHSGVSSPRRVGEGVEVRVEQRLLGCSIAPFLGSLGTRGHTVASKHERAIEVPLLVQRVSRNVEDDRFEAPDPDRLLSMECREQNVVGSQTTRTLCRCLRHFGRASAFRLAILQH
jgi:hypothetical protein